MKGQVQPYKKARLWLRNHRTVIMVALCMAIMICPAFAVDVVIDDATKTRLTSMFSGLDTVYSFIKGVCLVVAAASVASLGYAFFFITSSDAEERITKAKARLFHIVTACGVLFMLPTILTIAQGAIGTTAWNPVETASNHIITPVEVKDSASSLKAFEGMDSANSESGENSDRDSSGDGSEESSGTGGSNSATQKPSTRPRKVTVSAEEEAAMKKEADKDNAHNGAWKYYNEYYLKEVFPNAEDEEGFSQWCERHGLISGDLREKWK